MVNGLASMHPDLGLEFVLPQAIIGISGQSIPYLSSAVDHHVVDPKFNFSEIVGPEDSGVPVSADQSHLQHSFRNQLSGL